MFTVCGDACQTMWRCVSDYVEMRVRLCGEVCQAGRRVRYIINIDSTAMYCERTDGMDIESDCEID